MTHLKQFAVLITVCFLLSASGLAQEDQLAILKQEATAKVDQMAGHTQQMMGSLVGKWEARHSDGLRH